MSRAASFSFHLSFLFIKTVVDWASTHIRLHRHSISSQSRTSCGVGGPSLHDVYIRNRQKQANRLKSTKTKELQVYVKVTSRCGVYSLLKQADSGPPRTNTTEDGDVGDVDSPWHKLKKTKTKSNTKLFTLRKTKVKGHLTRSLEARIIKKTQTERARDTQTSDTSGCSRQSLWLFPAHFHFY